MATISGCWPGDKSNGTQAQGILLPFQVAGLESRIAQQEATMHEQQTSWAKQKDDLTQQVSIGISHSKNVAMQNLLAPNRQVEPLRALISMCYKLSAAQTR
eukprot:1158431-Pelagomonas_calceolata.AAC.5